jgi:hypothetical protein
MTTPTITLYPDTLPAKEQANAAFDTNVDNFMDWLTLTNGPELQTMVTYTQDVADSVLATALAGDLPALTGKAGDYIRANAAEDGGEFRTPAQVVEDISASPRYGPVTTLTPAATVDIDLSLGDYFKITLDEDTTFTFSNPPANGTTGRFVLILTQHSTAVTITWPSSIDWAAATAPDAPEDDKVNAYGFVTDDSGAVYYGFLGGADLG